jgi:hypothetical protein
MVARIDEMKSEAPKVAREVLFSVDAEGSFADG